MHKKLLFLASITFFLGVLFLGAKVIEACSNGRWGTWNDTSSCVASQCGTSTGTKNQSKTCESNNGSDECNPGITVCDKGCPAVTFTDSRQVIDVPAHYEYADKVSVVDVAGHYSCDSFSGYHLDGTKCKKSGHQDKDAVWVPTTYKLVCPSGYQSNPGHSNCRKRVDDTYKTETFGPITVQYGEKSEDPNHCHRPTGASLNVPSWAMDEFNELPQKKNHIDINCHWVDAQTETRVEPCNDAPIVACPTSTPTPTPTPTATPTPTPTPTPTGCEDDCQGTPTPTPTPTVTPTPTPSSSDGGGVGGPAGAPVCTNTAPAAPTLLSATVVGANSIKILWNKVSGADHYSIFYGPTSGNYLYGVPDTGNTDNFVINGLGAGCFAVKAANGCAPGPLSNEVCTGGVLGTQVLGASTMGGTGVADEAIFNLLFIIGSLATSFGIRKISTSKIK